MKLLLLAVLSIITLIWTPITLAQTQPLDITTSPDYIELKLAPGSKTTSKVRFRNNLNSSTKFNLAIKSLGTTETGQMTITDLDPNDSTINWVKLSQTEVIAPAKEWIEVTTEIEMPKEAAYGYYFAVVISPQDPNISTSDNTTKLVGSVAIPILLIADQPGAKFEGKISKFTAVPDWTEYLPVNLNVEFQNQGNVHIRPQGSVFIQDWKGKTIATLDINHTGGNILPNSSRQFSVLWNDSFVSYEPKMVDGKPVVNSEGQPEKELKWRFDKLLDLRIGKYTAKVIMIISDGQRDIPFEEVVSFWVFPWKIVLGVIAIAIFASMGIIGSLKQLWRIVNKVFKRK